MLKKLMLATIASVVVMSGLTSAAPPEKQRFLLGISGSITTPDILDTEIIKNTNKQKRIVFQAGTPLSVKFNLEDFWRSESTDYNVSGLDGVDCFEVGEVSGAVHIQETKSGESKVQMWFDSTYKPDDEPPGPEVRYQLVLTGDPWSDVFPPQLVGDDSEMLATHWEMRTEGKGRYRNDSCKGSGVFPDDTRGGEHDYDPKYDERPLLIVEQIDLCDFGLCD